MNNDTRLAVLLPPSPQPPVCGSPERQDGEWGRDWDNEEDLSGFNSLLRIRFKIKVKIWFIQLGRILTSTFSQLHWIVLNKPLGCIRMREKPSPQGEGQSHTPLLTGLHLAQQQGSRQGFWSLTRQGHRSVSREPTPTPFQPLSPKSRSSVPHLMWYTSTTWEKCDEQETKKTDEAPLWGERQMAHTSFRTKMHSQY